MMGVCAKSGDGGGDPGVSLLLVPKLGCSVSTTAV